jgi:DNA-binding transcriptional ArsR family regulator
VWADELSASEISQHFPAVTRSAISQHLTILRRSGLVRERRDGTRRLYSVNKSELAKLRAFLDSFWTNNLEQLRTLTEADEHQRRENS